MTASPGTEQTPAAIVADVVTATDPSHKRGRAWEDPRWTWWLLVSDVASTVLSVAIALTLLGAVATTRVNRISEFGPNFRHSVIFPFGVVIGMLIAGRYRSSQRSPNQSSFILLKDYLLAISLAGVISLTVVNAVHHILGTTRIGATQIIAECIVAFVLVPIARALLRHHALRRRPVRTIIVDSGLRKDRVATHVAIQHGFQLIGWVVPKEPVPDDAIGTIEQLPDLVATYDIDRVIIGSTERIGAETMSIYRQILPMAHVSIVPRSFELVSWRSSLTDLSGLPLLEVAPPLMTRWDRIAKRGVDVAVSGLALILTLPITIAIAIAIKLTSPGPVLFRQDRVGRDRELFEIIKFRSMTVASDPEPSLGALSDDHDEIPLHHRRNKAQTTSRVTKFGGFLRRTGLDEVPQFYNVLRGDMSLVGPRPFISSESEPAAGWSARRYEVRPGITGIWQVSGRNDLSADELRQLDYLYVASWSMWWDLRIITETPSAMFRGRGAY